MGGFNLKNINENSESLVIKSSVTFTNTTASTSSTVGAVLLSGGLSISLSTDATSSTNGGSLTTAGGAAVAKALYVGGDMVFANNTIIRRNTTDGSDDGVLVITGGGGDSAADRGSKVFMYGNEHATLPGRIGISAGSTGLIGFYTGAEAERATVSSAGIWDFPVSTTSTSSTAGAITVSGGISISNATDATSSTNGGTITTAGGIAVAKKIYTGDSVILADSSRAIGMNTSDTQTGQTSYYMDAITSILFSGSAAGVSTGQVTPLVTNSGDDFDGLYKGAAAQYDFWRTYVNIPVGTYTFRLKAVSGSDRGIVSLVIDGTSVGTMDLYAASGVLTLGSVTGISVSTAGIKKIELQVNSKNASSSNYYFIWKNAGFIRTS